jgi:hypothetical protein
MPTQKYALVRGEEKTLVAYWNFGWNNIHIELDGKEIGIIENRKKLQEGQTFTLPDKSTLEVKLQNSLLSSGLILTHNGVPVPDSIKDPMTDLRNSYIVAYVVAVYNIIIGFLFVQLKLDTPYLPQFGYITFVLGIAYAILARRISKKSLAAVIALLILFALEAALEAVTNYSLWFYLRVLLIYYIFQGFVAIRKLNAEEAEKIPMISE